MHRECQPEWSLRNKLKLSVCCFSGSVHDHQDPLDYKQLQPSKTPRTPWTPISPCAWLKKSDPTDSGDSTRSRKSRTGRKHHRYSQSADFTYDPSSYALNFEDESRFHDDEFPSRDFASRLTASAPMPSSAKYLP